MKLKKFNHIKDYPQCYTATILNWKKLLKPDKYKRIIIESSPLLVFFTNNQLTLKFYIHTFDGKHQKWQKLFSTKIANNC